MFRFTAVVAAALALVAASAAYAAPTTADAGLGGQGYLYVLGNQAEGSHFNKTAVISKEHLQIGKPNNSWNLQVVKKATHSTPAVVTVAVGAESCLTAHTDKGASYLYFDECIGTTTKTGDALEDLKARQYFDAVPGGKTVNLVQNGNGKYPARPNVHIIDKTQEVHLTTENGAHNKQLYFQAFDVYQHSS